MRATMVDVGVARAIHPSAHVIWIRADFFVPPCNLTMKFRPCCSTVFFPAADLFFWFPRPLVAFALATRSSAAAATRGGAAAAACGGPRAAIAAGGSRVGATLAHSQQHDFPIPFYHWFFENASRPRLRAHTAQSRGIEMHGIEILQFSDNDSVGPSAKEPRTRGIERHRGRRRAGAHEQG
eukprot:m.66442 g.66442  ORF g.66442 m.66442 type:complete len:181 (+) comp18081_c0_seq2:1943-2485(+)